MGQAARGENRPRAMQVERSPAVAPGFLPVWGAETMTPPVSDLFAAAPISKVLRVEMWKGGSSK